MVFVRVNGPVGEGVGLLVMVGVVVTVAELAHVLEEVAVIVSVGIEVFVGFDGEVGEVELPFLLGHPWRIKPQNDRASNQMDLLSIGRPLNSNHFGRPKSAALALTAPLATGRIIF
jgi:hypothetical protein